jgi:biopolymer transport protein ExbD
VDAIAPPACIVEEQNVVRIQASGALCYVGRETDLNGFEKTLLVSKRATKKMIFRIAASTETQQYQYETVIKLLNMFQRLGVRKVEFVEGDRR